ncbi:hypothetical protein L9F63_013082 [Diploptera punctata]|uniref:Uncharacterized protein n=1 Tax=Diploptera punctata TaxID=6984 RepID=A0AAD8AAX6_DIPPU|nr:hypothetical protein L9F63_013082 [Diploptera punctata]
MVSLAGMIIGLAFGIGGIALIVYCVNFDKLRRSDPNYKEKVKERRKATRAAKKEKVQRKKEDIELMREKYSNTINDFVISEIAKSDLLLSTGEIEEAVDHLVDVVLVADKNTQFLNIMQEVLPPEAYDLLIMKLSEYRG